MGFSEVYDYAVGKLDWMAAGLPTQGTNAARPRAKDVVRRDAPTCHLDERLGEVAARVAAAGWDACVVVNDESVVLGLLRAKELAADPELRIEQAMRPGPEHIPALRADRGDGEADGGARSSERPDHDLGRAAGRSPPTGGRRARRARAPCP
jgi:hypothetical protein